MLSLHAAPWLDSDAPLDLTLLGLTSPHASVIQQCPRHPHTCIHPTHPSACLPQAEAVLRQEHYCRDFYGTGGPLPQGAALVTSHRGGVKVVVYDNNDIVSAAVALRGNGWEESELNNVGRDSGGTEGEPGRAVDACAAGTGIGRGHVHALP